MRISLPDVTLVCVDTIEPWKALSAIHQSLSHIQPACTLFFTKQGLDIPEGEYQVIPVEINSIQEYSDFIMKGLSPYIHTSHVLIIQADGYVLDGAQWTDEFLSVDYIGAKWLYSDRNVGNGGFSLRSKKLLDATLDPMIHGIENEDHLICRTFRGYLEETHGIKFADESLADRFAYELNRPEQPTFGFHQSHFTPFRERVLIKRHAALGDVVMTEPIIAHFVESGYDVALETHTPFYDLFRHYRYPLYDGFPLNTIGKVVDLNMAYEVRPKESVFDSYCKAAGIQAKRRNPILGTAIAPEKKPFRKYALIHSPTTNLPHRNAVVDDWTSVVLELNEKGYMVAQIGGEDIAPQINTPTPKELSFYISNADLFIGVDSGPLQVAVAYGIPSVGLFGSVDWTLRYEASPKLQTLTGACPHQNCYHNSIGTTGTKCLLGQSTPQCTLHTSKKILNAITQIS